MDKYRAVETISDVTGVQHNLLVDDCVAYRIFLIIFINNNNNHNIVLNYCLNEGRRVCWLSRNLCALFSVFPLSTLFFFSRSPQQQLPKKCMIRMQLYASCRSNNLQTKCSINRNQISKNSPNRAKTHLIPCIQGEIIKIIDANITKSFAPTRQLLLCTKHHIECV